MVTIVDNEFKVEHLDENNQDEWFANIRCMLVIKKAWPAISTPTEAAGKAADELARAIIETHVTKPYKRIVRNAKSAKEAYDELQDLFKTLSYAKTNALLTEWETVRVERGETMASYVDRVQTLAAKLEDIEEPVSDRQVVNKILHGLSSSYDMVVTMLQALDVTPKIPEVLRQLVVAEQKLVAKEKKEELAEAYYAARGAAKVNIYANKRCYTCNKLGHIKAHCPDRIGDGRNLEANAKIAEATAFGAFVEVDPY
jgi:DNA-binding FrmR family transcriptional regulator